MSSRAIGHIGLVVLLVLAGLHREAARADEQTCTAPQLYANLMKSDSEWEVEEDPLPPKERITVGYVAFQPVQRLAVEGGAVLAAAFGEELTPARIRVVGNDVSLDRIRFQIPLGPEMWTGLMTQRYAQPRVRFILSAPDGACGARALVLAIDSKAAPKPFPDERWQFKRK